jgi:hypothetical protein
MTGKAAELRRGRTLVSDAAASYLGCDTNGSETEADMRSFIAACVAAIAIAALGALVLNQMQESVAVAYTTQSAKL